MNPTPENETPLTDAAEKQSIAAFIEEMGVDAIFTTDGYDFARELERDRKRLRDSIAALKNATEPLDQWAQAMRVQYALKESHALDAKLKKEAE